MRAAVSAFVDLSRPSKRDGNQIEDLALPILPFVSVSAKRFICAALAENRNAPLRLVKTLCDSPVDICAPLLLKSPVLMPVDLVTVIGRHGKEHARIIACRTHLPNEVIEALAGVDDDVVRQRISDGNAALETHANVKPANADDARRLLVDLALSMADTRGATVQSADAATQVSGDGFSVERLIRLALHEKTEILATALADDIGLPYGRCMRMIRRLGSGELLTSLRALGLNSNQAFVVVCAQNPLAGSSKTEIRLFLERFDALDPDKAIETVRRWKADEIAMEFIRQPANTAAVSAAGAKLKA
ncbi:MAG: DUF2336 domain-containing protein [Rhizobiaceae bacterium]